jgi:hypothetical protein
MIEYLQIAGVVFSFVIGCVQLWRWYGEYLLKWYARRSIASARERLRRLEKRYKLWSDIEDNLYLGFQYIVGSIRWGLYLFALGLIELSLGLISLSNGLVMGDIPIPDSSPLVAHYSTVSFCISSVLFFVSVFVIVYNAASASQDLSNPNEKREQVIKEIRNLDNKYPEVSPTSNILDPKE